MILTTFLCTERLINHRPMDGRYSIISLSRGEAERKLQTKFSMRALGWPAEILTPAHTISTSIAANIAKLPGFLKRS